MKAQQPEVLYEDNHLLILNKPSGWLVQGDETGDRTLTDWARDYIKQNLVCLGFLTTNEQGQIHNTAKLIPG